MTWRSTGLALDAIPMGRPLGVEIEGTEIVLGRVGNDVYALADHCPHQDGQLSEGTMEGSHLSCPLHGSVFDVRTGAVVMDPFGIEPPEGEVTPVARYGSKIEGDTVWVELP